MSQFTSGFADKIEAMTEFRTIHGYRKETHLPNLLRFDKYCADHLPRVSELSRKVVHGWLDEESISAKYTSGKANTIRQFGKYLNALGEEAYILSDKFASFKSSFAPYIFTDDEMIALFTEIDRLPADKNEPFLSEIASAMFRLIYTCGLRPNEGRELLTENINLNTGEVIITNTKRKKDRVIVMSDDMLTFCREYDLRRNTFSSGSPYFFPSYDGSAFSRTKILCALNKAWITATCTPQNPIPNAIRVYDLRHRFASACLNRWLDNGENLMVMLPYLREYMGHSTMNETAYYIHILPENLTKSSAVDWKVFNEMFPEVIL